MRTAARADRIASGKGRRPSGDDGDHEKDDGEHGEEPADFSREAGDAAKAEQRSDQGDDEEDDRIVEHDLFLRSPPRSVERGGSGGTGPQTTMTVQQQLVRGSED